MIVLSGMFLSYTYTIKELGAYPNKHHRRTMGVLKKECHFLQIAGFRLQMLSQPKRRRRRIYPESWRQFAILPAIPFPQCPCLMQCEPFLVLGILCYFWSFLCRLGSGYPLPWPNCFVFVVWHSNSYNTVCSQEPGGWWLVTGYPCAWGAARRNAEHMCWPGELQSW